MALLLTVGILSYMGCFVTRSWIIFHLLSLQEVRDKPGSLSCYKAEALKLGVPGPTGDPLAVSWGSSKISTNC